MFPTIITATSKNQFIFYCDIHRYTGFIALFEIAYQLFQYRKGI